MLRVQSENRLFYLKRALGNFGALLLLASCATPSLTIPENSYNSTRIAARNVASPLANHLNQLSGGTFSDKKSILIGPMVNALSGEITKSGRELQTFLLWDLKSLATNRQIEPLGAEMEARGIVVTGTVSYDKPDPKKPDDSWFLVKLSVTGDDGGSLTNVDFRINARQFDPTPSRFFRDSPVFLPGYTSMGTFSSASSSKAEKTERLRLLDIEAKTDRAVQAYEAGQYSNSEQLFSSIHVRDSNNLTALSGIYQSLAAQKKTKAAEEALDNLIAAGIRTSKLSFRFLFRVRSVEFRDDLEIAEQYPLWIRRVAAQLKQSKSCLNVQGHSSKSGTAAYNDQLSLKRAEKVIELLARNEPLLKGRLKADGFGFNKNIIGSGTDDVTDAIDRRVEFKVHTC